MTLVTIPAGTFEWAWIRFAPRRNDQRASGVTAPRTIGDYGEVPVHHVTISHAFAMSATEVTVDQFCQFGRNTKAILTTRPMPRA